MVRVFFFFFFFQAEDGIRDLTVTGVQTCALPISHGVGPWPCRSLHVRNTVSMPAGGPPGVGSLNSACSDNKPPPAFQRRSTPGAVGGWGEPTNRLGTRTAGARGPAENSGPPRPIVA